MKTYNIGIIGYGGFGKFLHHWWGRMEGIKVTAIADHKYIAGQPAQLKQYTNWEDLLADSDIDIVSIATPPAFHAKMACAAMRMGKHVLLEKPIALSAEGAEAILDVQRSTGKVVMVDHMLRYNPIVRALLRIGQDGGFGKLRHAAVTNYAQDESLPLSHWFWDRSLSGGIFVEHAVHFFDIVNALAGERPDRVFGCAHSRNEKQQDQVSAMVAYPGGLIASHYHSFAGPGFFEQTTIRLAYDRAKIEVEGWVPMKGSFKALVGKATRRALELLPGLEIIASVPIANLADVSRPEGWGSEEETTPNRADNGTAVFGADEMVSGTFELDHGKSEAYGQCLQHILADLIAKIEDPSHQTAVTAEDAYESLKVALSAQQQARMSY